MSSLAGLVVTDENYRIKYVYSGFMLEELYMDISGVILTIYDDLNEWKAHEPIDLKDVSFTANRFPQHRIRHHRFPGGMWWTTELHPPELGNDSAMEVGLEC